MQTDFDVPLDESSKRFKSGRIQLDLLRGNDQSRERQFAVVALVGNLQKSQVCFTLVCSAMVANFEGQLLVNPDRLEVEDAEYQQILQKL